MASPHHMKLDSLCLNPANSRFPTSKHVQGIEVCDKEDMFEVFMVVLWLLWVELIIYPMSSIPTPGPKKRWKQGLKNKKISQWTPKP